MWRNINSIYSLCHLFLKVLFVCHFFSCNLPPDLLLLFFPSGYNISTHCLLQPPLPYGITLTIFFYPFPSKSEFLVFPGPVLPAPQPSGCSCCQSVYKPMDFLGRLPLGGKNGEGPCAGSVSVVFWWARRTESQEHSWGPGNSIVSALRYRERWASCSSDGAPQPAWRVYQENFWRSEERIGWLGSRYAKSELKLTENEAFLFVYEICQEIPSRWWALGTLSLAKFCWYFIPSKATVLLAWCTAASSCSLWRLKINKFDKKNFFGGDNNLQNLTGCDLQNLYLSFKLSLLWAGCSRSVEKPCLLRCSLGLSWCKTRYMAVLLP